MAASQGQPATEPAGRPASNEAPRRVQLGEGVGVRARTAQTNATGTAETARMDGAGLQAGGMGVGSEVVRGVYRQDGAGVKAIVAPVQASGGTAVPEAQVLAPMPPPKLGTKYTR
jgi:hypothetical protein